MSQTLTIPLFESGSMPEPNLNAIDNTNTNDKITHVNGKVTFVAESVKTRLLALSKDEDLFKVKKGNYGQIISKELLYTNIATTFEDFDEDHILYEHETYNKFYTMLHHAFCNHYSIVITPDLMWNIITKSLAIKMTNDAEKLKESDPNFKKIEVIIEADHFKINNIGNEEFKWLADEFAKGARDQFDAELYDLVITPFSTTSVVDQYCHNIALMDMTKGYVNYTCVTMCGIPEIKLEGTKEDWQNLYDRAKRCCEKADFLEWWVTLEFILKPFVNAFDQTNQKEELEFWQAIYRFKNYDGSGPKGYDSGWFQGLFPFDSKLKIISNMLNVNSLRPFQKKIEHGSTGSINSLVSVPFKWNYYGISIDMKYIAGPMFITINKNDYTMRLVNGCMVLAENEKYNLAKGNH